MKKLILALSGFLVLSSCSDKELDKSIYGHWVNSEYLEAIDKARYPSEAYNIPCQEFIVDDHDSSITFYRIGNRKDNFSFEVVNGNTIRVKKFINARDNESDLVLSRNGKTLSYKDEVLNKTFTFVKLDSSVSPGENLKGIQSYLLPYVNNKYISGTYTLNDTATVIFTGTGYIKGIPELYSYSLCLSGSCTTYSKNSTIFLTDRRFQGYYYDWEKVQDTLFIYQMDYSRFPDKQKDFQRQNVMFKLVKAKN